MHIHDTSSPADIRYEPDERSPFPLSLGLGIQAALLVFPTVVLVPAIIVRAAGLDAQLLSWSVSAALLVCGLITLIQSFRTGFIGAGHVLISTSAATSIAVCILALSAGGIALMMNLVIVSALFQLLLSSKLSWLRRVITPMVSGMVLMLIAFAVMPVAFDMLTYMPAGASPAAAPVTAAITLLVLVALVFGAKGVLGLWAPVIALVAGCAGAAFFGMYQGGLVLDAPWVGIPAAGRPHFSLNLGADFWILLPAFLFVSLANTMGNVSAGVAVQRASRRNPHSIDFRAVQEGLTANGLGDLLAGLAGTIPVKSDPAGNAFIRHTGVAARRLGMCIGIILLALAFLPKLTAVLLAIPGPVIAAYLAVSMALVFVQGMKMVVQDGIDYRKAAVIGLAFWLGVGFHNQAVFADMLGETWGALFGNGMTVGGLAVILLTIIMELTGPRRYSKVTALDPRVLPRLEDFLRRQALRLGWGEAAIERLFHIGEETLLCLSEGHDEAATGELRSLLVTVTNDGPVMEVEFVSAIGEENLEDQMRLLGDHAEARDGHEISLRILQHFASSVRHQQYHGMDVVTVRVSEGDND